MAQDEFCFGLVHRCQVLEHCRREAAGCARFVLVLVDPVAPLDHTLSVFGSDGRIPVNVLRGVGAVFDAEAYGKVLDWISSPLRAVPDI